MQPSNRVVRGQSMVSVLSNRCKNLRSKPVKLRSSLSLSTSDFYGKRIFATRSGMVPKRDSSRVFFVDSQVRKN